MDSKRENFIGDLLQRMSLEEKVGQCFLLSWRGSMITPSAVEMLQRLYTGGLILEPWAAESARGKYYGNALEDRSFERPADYYTISQTYFKADPPSPNVTPSEYASRLNRMKQIAMNRRTPIPLAGCIDNENAVFNDYEYGRVSGFPAQMGIAASGETDLAYRCALAMGKQLAALGVSVIFSPVCDVNIPHNKEIKFRSFSENIETVERFAVAMAGGFNEAGLVATGKHFPGKGNSVEDAHYHLETISSDLNHMHEIELRPYKALIESGFMGAVMTAHSLYPALDSEGLPATLSRTIITDVLRKEMGFEGVITTDALGMAAILKNWGIPRACVMALKAGVNLLMVKSDSEVREQCFFTVKHAVEKGEITAEELDRSVGYVLGMKYDQRMFDNGGLVDSKKADSVVTDESIRKAARESSRKAITLIRDNENLLPLKPDRKVMVIEQLRPYRFVANDSFRHNHVFCEHMLKHSSNLILADCSFIADKQDYEELLGTAKQADTVVVTNFYWRQVHDSNREFVKKLIEEGNRVVVITNDPYETGAVESAGTVVCNFGSQPESLEAAADFLFGKIEAEGNLKRIRVQS